MHLLPRKLQTWLVKFGTGVALERLMAHVSHHPDDSHPLRVRTGAAPTAFGLPESHALADRVFRRPETLFQSLADQANAWRSQFVAFVENPALPKGDADGPKIVGAHGLKVRARIAALLVGRLILGRELRAVPGALRHKRRAVVRADRFHFGHFIDLLEQAREAIHAGLGGFVAVV